MNICHPMLINMYVTKLSNQKSTNYIPQQSTITSRGRILHTESSAPVSKNRNQIAHPSKITRTHYQFHKQWHIPLVSHNQILLHNNSQYAITNGAPLAQRTKLDKTNATVTHTRQSPTTPKLKILIIPAKFNHISTNPHRKNQ